MPSSPHTSFVLESPPAPPPPLPEISVPPELQSGSPSTRRLLDHIHSFSGDNGGSFPSPVWCCGLEAGGGERNDSSLWSERFWEDTGIESVARHPTDPALWRIDETKWLDGQSESRLLTSQRQLIAELTGAPYSERSPKHLKEDPGYFLKHGEGLSLNLSPLSMPSRALAQAQWLGKSDPQGHRKLIRTEDGASHTFRDWTGFPTYREFFSFCAQERHAIYKAAREHFTPALIYCGGITALDDYRRAWADTDTAFATASFLYGNRRIRLHLAWLPNASQAAEAPTESKNNEAIRRRKTLLVIGPFFVNPYGLGWRRVRQSVACIIRAIALEETADKP